ncbi:MAG: tetratricopeptide repeat protein, partial [Nannocystaceae bacterium]
MFVVDEAAPLAFHSVVRWTYLLGLTVFTSSLAAGCHKEQTAAPDDGSCSGSSCVERAEAALWEGRDKEAREPLLALCDEDSDSFSCLRLADLYRDGKGGPKDLKAAAEYYEKSCELDLKEACERRFELARDQGDTDVALTFATQACEGGRPYGCMAAGPMLVAAGKREEAIASFEKGCELGEAGSCSAAGDLLYDPKGSKYDNGQALSNYIHACQGYDGHGCLRAGIFFHD